MQKFLALTALAIVSGQSQASGASSSPLPDIRQVVAQKPTPPAQQRQLSVQERAELRRQLSQYTRVPGKGS